jgi:amino acid adenylation domain-containing protein
MSPLLQDYARTRAEQDPASVAVVLGDERLTYGKLEARSNRLARLLKDVGCSADDRVALLTSKGPAAIVAMHAALKADCAYVPVDVATPAARVANVLAAAQPKLLLVDSSARALLEGLFDEGLVADSIALGSLEAVNLEGERFRTTFAQPDADAFEDGPLPSHHTADDIAHILFTSGSTGIPKGVPITHSNVSHFVEWAVPFFGISSSDRNSGHHPLHFDLSTFDIYGAFLAGAELHLVPAELNLRPDRMAEFIRDSNLTQWFSVPSTLTLMSKFDALRGLEFPSLRRLLWCGEVLPTPTLIYWMHHLPEVTFTNLYGPTEATIASSYYTVPGCPDSDTEQIPIGVACDGEELHVLDHELRPTDDIGDIYIAGVGLSPGYWRDDEQTAKAFVRNPFSREPDGRMYRTGDLGRVGEDGLVYFLGRADSQIKSRGYRIELGEIEAALNSLAELRESVAVGVPTDGFEGVAICCAYVPAQRSSIRPARLRQRLSAQLPSYMMPARWLELEELPKNVNGKIDRKWIRERFASESPSDRAPVAKTR